MDELLALLERYPYWPHPPRAATRAQHARFAQSGLRGAEITEHRSAERLEAAVARHHLPWDTEKLGFPAARVAFVIPPNATCGFEVPVRATIERARADGYGSLFTRVDAGELGLVQALEAAGFITVDAILSQYIQVPEAGALPAAREGVTVRIATAADADLLARITDASITQSRFHGDPKIGVPRARELYREWARNAVNGLNDLTLIGEVRGEPAGYLSGKDVKGALDAYGFGYCRIELVAVLDGFRGTGVVQAMTARLLAECPSRGWGLCGIGTQISNVRAIRAYAKAGFAPGDSIFSLRWRRDG